MKLDEMHPRCVVGLFGSTSAIEDLWSLVYQLKEEVKQLKAQAVAAREEQ